MSDDERSNDQTHILILAPQTCTTRTRSGIQRVVMQVAYALLPMAPIQFVKWDRIDGQLRYFNAQDLDVLFESRSWPEGVHVHPCAERRSYRFADTLPPGSLDRTWLLMPEIAYHLASGLEIYASILAQAREYGLRTAAVFYDLIPITNPDYRQIVYRPHERYVRELMSVDLLMPISAYAADDLRRYHAETLGLDEAGRRRIGQVIAAVPLATVNSGVEARRGAAKVDTQPSDLVFLLGTVEPRKRQVEVLRAFKRARISERFGLQAVVVGSLHPMVADAFRELVGDAPDITYHGYADDALVADLFERARFCVFASNDEGFGLPICESLAHGVPCLAANFGAMREVGEGGGCLLVDVNDEAEIQRGLERLASDDDLVAGLRGEIAVRRFRTWEDYARDVLGLMRSYLDEYGTGRFADDVAQAVGAFLGGPRRQDLTVSRLTFDGEPWTLTRTEDLGRLKPPDSGRSVVLVAGSGRSVERAGPAALGALFGADAWIFEERSAFTRLVEKARASGYPGMLPTRCAFVDGDAAAGGPARGERAAETLAALAGDIARRRRTAARQKALQRAHRDGTEFRTGTLLNLVISTYNRGPFVAENVRWLLSQIGRFGGRIKLIVVDNASSDDTETRLAAFAGDLNLTIVRNAANTGMLGNLQVCSTQTGAQHSWVVGDDDFIVPGALDTVLRAIEADPYLPFVFINFGVYHRVALGADDRAETLIRDPILLAPTPSPSGLYPVREIAAEHDNLFTAIYPIVFRTDILSACFNYPFTGRPFSSLVESIPTTKIILETYGDTEAQWIAEVGVVGNAHNSWARYRVPWHGALMPLAFELARDAGVKADRLHTWSKLHRQLFDDACILFPDERLDGYFQRSILDASLRVFREDVENHGHAAPSPGV